MRTPVTRCSPCLRDGDFVISMSASFEMSDFPRDPRRVDDPRQSSSWRHISRQLEYLPGVNEPGIQAAPASSAQIPVRSPRILVVDGDPEVLSAALGNEGLDVVTVTDGVQGWERVRTTHPDVVVLDIATPGISGIELYTRIREVSDVPVLLLVSRGWRPRPGRGSQLGGRRIPQQARKSGGRRSSRASHSRASRPASGSVALCLQVLLHLMRDLRQRAGCGLPKLPRGAGFFVQVLDFGIARVIGEPSNELGFRGTPLYACPEQWSAREPDQRGDIYSLGCVLFECLTGAPPFDGEFAELMNQHMHRPRPQVGDVLKRHVPEALEVLVGSMLAIDPEDRPSDLREVIEAMERVLSMRTLSGRAATDLDLPVLAGRSRTGGHANSRQQLRPSGFPRPGYVIPEDHMSPGVLGPIPLDRRGTRTVVVESAGRLSPGSSSTPSVPGR